MGTDKEHGEKLLTEKEAAYQLGISVKKVRALVNGGLLRGLNLNGLYIRESAAEEFIHTYEGFDISDPDNVYRYQKIPPADNEWKLISRQNETADEDTDGLKLLLNTNAAGELLGIKTVTVWGLIKKGLLPAIKITDYRISSRTLADFAYSIDGWNLHNGKKIIRMKTMKNCFYEIQGRKRRKHDDDY